MTTRRGFRSDIDFKGTEYNVDTKTVALDFANVSQAQEAGYKALEDILKDVDVGVLSELIRHFVCAINLLVNNVGVSHSIPVPFAETEQAEMDAIINVVCRSMYR